MSSLLVFKLDHWRCGLPLETVERSYRAVAVTPLPGAPEKVLGIVDVHGVVHPVIALRHCFGLAPRAVSPSDHLVIGHSMRRDIALLVDSVDGVVDCTPDDIAEAETILPGMEYVRGVARLHDGLVLIHDLDSLLSLEEEETLDRALES